MHAANKRVRGGQHDRIALTPRGGIVPDADDERLRRRGAHNLRQPVDEAELAQIGDIHASIIRRPWTCLAVPVYHRRVTRIVFLSDVHSNLTALEAVLGHAEAGGPIGSVWCLGDSVGYGPQPAECIARLREVGALMVAGNHDRAATGAMGVEEFNPDAAAAALWTRDQLSPEEATFLDNLPEVAYASPESGHENPQAADFSLVHGTLRWPIWEYLHTHDAALAHLQRQETPFSLVGHTHVPMVVAEGPEFPHGCEMYYLEEGSRLRLERERKLVVNPGSVGQPRDGDPRASYAVYDSESAAVTLHRVDYDIAATQKLMEEAGLPRWLIERLSMGR